jgi:radical SAM superfamily enzyme YgiQ (UPF0313 family)
LKNAGCVRVSYGVEVGDEKYRNEFLNKRISNEKLFETARLLDAYKMKSKTFSMLGFADRTLRDDLETLKLNWKLRPTYAHASLFVPLPRTAMYDRLYAEKKLVSDFGFKDSYMLVKMNSNVRFHNGLEKMQIENLAHFFSLCVFAPMLYPLIRILLYLPLTALYFRINKIFVFSMHACHLDSVDFSSIIKKYPLQRTVSRFFEQVKEF